MNPCDTTTDSELRGPSGHLANIVTESTGRGSPACPWRIRAEKGQRINLTLYDFTAAADQRRLDTGGGVGGPHVPGGGDGEDPGAGGRYCQVYAIIKEASNERETAVCGGSQRERAVYTSTGEAVDVRITGLSTPDQQVYFVLKYEGGYYL